MDAQTVSNLGGDINWNVAQGTDFGPVTLTFTNPDNTPLNLTGCTLTSDIRKLPGGPIVANATVTITNATGGIATYLIPHAVTAALTAGANLNDPASLYLWDLKLVDALGLSLIHI